MKEFFKGAMHMTIEEMKEKKREHGYTYNMMSQMSGGSAWNRAEDIYGRNEIAAL